MGQLANKSTVAAAKHLILLGFGEWGTGNGEREGVAKKFSIHGFLLRCHGVSPPRAGFATKFTKRRGATALARDHRSAAHLTRGVPPLEAARQRRGLKVAVLFLSLLRGCSVGRPSPGVCASPRPAVRVRCPRHGIGFSSRHGMTLKAFANYLRPIGSKIGLLGDSLP